MRLHVVSDLHVDHLANRKRLPGLLDEARRHPADGLVVAGDLSHKLAQVDETLRQLADLAPRRLFVAGNHDVWRVKPQPGDPADSWAKLAQLSDLAQGHGYAALEAGNATLGGLTFVGSVGWYDYSFASPRVAATDADYREKRWKDLTYMDRDYAAWGMPDAEVAGRLAQDVASRLKGAEGPVVFVSHHVPLAELVLRRGVDSWDFFNAYMGSSRLEAVLRARGVRRFIFGHTHRPVALVEPGRFILNNPLGYPRQALNPILSGFDVS